MPHRETTTVVQFTVDRKNICSYLHPIYWRLDYPAASSKSLSMFDIFCDDEYCLQTMEVLCVLLVPTKTKKNLRLNSKSLKYFFHLASNILFDSKQDDRDSCRDGPLRFQLDHLLQYHYCNLTLITQMIDRGGQSLAWGCTNHLQECLLVGSGTYGCYLMYVPVEGGQRSYYIKHELLCLYVLFCWSVAGLIVTLDMGAFVCVLLC